MTALRGTPFVPIRPSTFVPAAKTPNKSSYGVMLVPVTCVSLGLGLGYISPYNQVQVQP